MAGAKPARAAFQPAPYAGYDQQGVRGWLLFFCISFTILWPLWILSQYVFYWRFALSWLSVVGLFRLVFGVLAGVVLWMQKPVAMVLLRIYFVLGGALALLNLYGLAARLALHLHNPYIVVWPVVVSLGSSLVFLVSGVLYFSLSERVQATYGSKLFG